jgi:outer membrane protein W
MDGGCSMPTSRWSRWLAATIAAALLAAATPARAQSYDYDVRLRIGGYFPGNLPIKQGTLWSLQVRDYMNPGNGIAYEIGYFNEQRTDFMTLNFQGNPAIFTFHAQVKLLPVLFSFFHTWPFSRLDAYAGVGAGFYATTASSAGLNRKIGVGVKDVGDFRFLQDGTNYGLVTYAGVDLFPESRWGLAAEGRAHVVSQGYSGIEISVGSILRF